MSHYYAESVADMLTQCLALLQWHKTEAAQTRWERYNQMLTDMVASRHSPLVPVQTIFRVPKGFQLGQPHADAARTACLPQLHALNAGLLLTGSPEGRYCSSCRF